MRKLRLPAGLALAALLLAAPAASAATPAETYASLVATAEQGHKIDAQALRDAYVRLPNYDPYAMTRPPFVRLLSAYYKGDYDAACPMLEALLKTNYVETVLHVLRAKCLDRAHVTLEGLIAKLAVVQELTDAILKTGDGKSLATAYRIVTFSELAAVSGRDTMRFDGVAEISAGNHRYLLIEGPIGRAPARKPDGTTPPQLWKKIFFNIDAFRASAAPMPKNLFAGRHA
jgi:hypothetical protein